MGFLHQGHLSLVQECKNQCDITVVSIFVNPTQFAPNEDLSTYPRDFERDKKLLEENNVDVIFYPSVDEIYSYNFQTYVENNKISKILEGEFRPTHFRGVATIVSILFNCVKPHKAFFGQKDIQQAAIIKQMIDDLKFNIDLIVCTIVREPDGLAMSSRNIYLSKKEREIATNIYKTLQYGKKFILEDRDKNVQNIIANMKSYLLTDSEIIKIDYIAIVNKYGFYLEDFILDENNEYYLLIAARVGKTRLIDKQCMHEHCDCVWCRHGKHAH